MTLSSKVTRRSSIAAAALIAFTPGALAGQQPAAQADSEIAQPDDQTTDTRINSHITVIGAIRDPNATTEVVAEDESVPELPVVYEDEADGAKVRAAADAAPPASPAR